MAEIDQIAVMGQDLLGCESEGHHVGFEFTDLLFGKWLGIPLALVFGKQSKSSGTNFICIERCVLNPPRCTYMGANPFD